MGKVYRLRWVELSLLLPCSGYRHCTCQHLSPARRPGIIPAPHTKHALIWSHTVRKFLADFAVCDWWHYCKALCDVKFRQIEGKGRKFCQIELSNIAASLKLSHKDEWIFDWHIMFTYVANVHIVHKIDNHKINASEHHIPYITLMQGQGSQCHTFLLTVWVCAVHRWCKLLMVLRWRGNF